MKITNKEIYEKVAEITAAFSNETKYIPIKLNFAIQKNLATFSALQQEIETARLKIAAEYGELDAENQRYIINKENEQKASQELNDLFNIEQEVDIRTCSLSQIEGIDLTLEQMQSIMFMIVED
jgi:hypothetical protein